jgi:hypothetical protein
LARASAYERNRYAEDAVLPWVRRHERKDFSQTFVDQGKAGIIFAMFSTEAAVGPLRVLLPTLGSAGDVHPTMALGLALQARRHRVTILTNEFYGEQIRAAEVQFIALGSVAEEGGCIASSKNRPIRAPWLRLPTSVSVRVSTAEAARAPRYNSPAALDVAQHA